MVVELIGGPLDGTLIDGAHHIPLCVSLPTDAEEVRAMYQAPCGCPCRRFRDGKIPYYFCGYDIVASTLQLRQQNQYLGSNLENS